MTEQEKKTLYQIKELTDKMLAFVNSSAGNSIVDTNLDDFINFEKKRQELIEDFFSQPVSESDSKQVADIIQQVLQLNEQITIVLEQNKKQLSKEYNQFKTSKKVNSAYLSNSV